MPDVDLDGTTAWAFTASTPDLNRLIPISGTAAWTFAASTSQLDRLRPISGSAAWTITASSAALQVSVRLAGAARWTFRALANLFYPPAIAPVPAGVAAKKVSVLTVSMPAPTLNALGRPTRPWLPS